MTTTPLPPPVPLTGIDCYIDPKDGKVKRYDHARADLEAENKRRREALRLIEHATAPTHDDEAYHENAYELARAALKDTK